MSYKGVDGDGKVCGVTILRNTDQQALLKAESSTVDLLFICV